MPLACSRFDVDLRTLQSDSSRRDNYLYSNTLETEQFPLATFILTGVEGLDGPLPDGEETSFTLIGNLTVHGVTNLISWEAKVTRDGDELSGDAHAERADCQSIGGTISLTAMATSGNATIEMDSPRPCVVMLRQRPL